MKLPYAHKERAPCGDTHVEDHRRVRAAATITAVLVGVIVMAASMSEMYAKCGPPCLQGLLQAQRERY